MRLIGTFITLILPFVASIDTDAVGHCSNFNDEVVNYFIPGQRTHRTTWSEAWEICNRCDSSLPIIRNRSEQEALFQFLSSKAIITGLVWTAGRNEKNSNWTWINGEPLKSKKMKTGRHLTTSVLGRELTYQAEDPLKNVSYICQFKSNDTICSENTTEKIVLKNGCLLDPASINQSTWYEARNECLERGGDLPILDDSDLDKLNQSSLWQDNITIWLGLRTHSWRWYSNETDSSGEIMYTNWNTTQKPDTYDIRCIAIQASDCKWRHFNCTRIHHIVCEKRDRNAKSSTEFSRPIVAITVATPGQIGSIPVYIGLWSGIVVAITIISVIIVVFAIRNHRKLSKKSRNPETSGRLEKSLQTTNEERAALVKPPLDSITGVYAEIRMATTSSTEDLSFGNAHPGIVYASLDFGNAPKNSNNNNTYPQGDLYAEVVKQNYDCKPAQAMVDLLDDIYANHNATQLIDSRPQKPSGAVYSNL